MIQRYLDSDQKNAEILHVIITWSPTKLQNDAKWTDGNGPFVPIWRKAGWWGKTNGFKCWDRIWINFLILFFASFPRKKDHVNQQSYFWPIKGWFGAVMLPLHPTPKGFQLWCRIHNKDKVRNGRWSELCHTGVFGSHGKEGAKELAFLNLTSERHMHTAVTCTSNLTLLCPSALHQILGTLTKCVLCQSSIFVFPYELNSTVDTLV